jgi:hypothetical protein
MKKECNGEVREEGVNVFLLFSGFSLLLLYSWNMEYPWKARERERGWLIWQHCPRGMPWPCGRAVGMWFLSSVATCACRAVRGCGPLWDRFKYNFGFAQGTFLLCNLPRQVLPSAPSLKKCQAFLGRCTFVSSKAVP